MASPQPRIGIVTYPGSQDDRDALWALAALDAEAVPVWHEERELPDLDAVVLPGGFSYGDYLRCGAIARFSRATAAACEFAASGGLVLGICNGFQVLCESHLLPGALIKNHHRKFICKDQPLRIENNRTAWTSDYTQGQEIMIPLKNMDGRFTADRRTVDELEAEGRVVFRYLDGNPNGSVGTIAGIASAEGNVVGLMPHPEHAIDQLTGPGTDGLRFFASIMTSAASA